MRTMIGLCMAFASSAAMAATDVSPIVPAADRAVTGPRALHLAVPQTQIETSIDIGRVAPAAQGGGLIGALIIESRDDRAKLLAQSQQDQAEAAVVPLRAALRDFDVDGLALATTRAALSRTTWFQAQPFTVARDASPQGRAAFLEASATPQTAFVTYRYALSPDFTYIRVNADIALARKPAAGSVKGAAPFHPFYEQHIASVVLLRSRSYEHRDNVANWSADNGKLARASLTAAFGQIEKLIPYALGLSDADVRLYTAKNREKAFGAGFYGPLIQRDEGSDGLLLWSNGLVHVQSTPPAQATPG